MRAANASPIVNLAASQPSYFEPPRLIGERRKRWAGAEWIEKLARSRPGVRIALVGATIDEARRVMVEGVSGILSVARRRHRVKWEPSLGRLIWPNGSEAQLFSGDNPDGLRGPEHDFAWCDELAKWREPEAAPRPMELLLQSPKCFRRSVSTG